MLLLVLLMKLFVGLFVVYVLFNVFRLFLKLYLVGVSDFKVILNDLVLVKFLYLIVVVNVIIWLLVEVLG